MARACALIPAAGRGARFGAAENKVFTPLLGRPLIGWTLQAFADCPAIESIVLVGAPGELERLRTLGERFGGGKLHAVVAGGATRQDSVRLGLDALPEGCEVVAIHDAARCCVTPALIESALSQAPTTVALPVRDTLVRTDGSNVARDGLHAVQTPQVFLCEALRLVHALALAQGTIATDDASLYREFGGPVTLTEGSAQNIKVTTPEDLVLAEAILRNRTHPPPRTSASPSLSEEKGTGGWVRVGHGYDVHRLVAGRELWLGGVHFKESPLGLDGHSDADAALHALCDALLGAAGLPDIGQLFPPGDAQHRDRASIEFVREVKIRLDEGGWTVSNVDLTIIAEAPKIGPRASEMKAVISQALGIEVGQVSIKATTNESLGFVGRGEGIAAQASALISRSTGH